MATRCYVTTRSHGVVMDGRYPGSWDATSIGERLHGLVDWVYRLRTTKVNGGSITFSPLGETNDLPNWDVGIRHWVTDPLDVNQTITGTLDWVLGTFRTDAASEVRWMVHVYVMAGDDTQAVRGTCFSGEVAPDAALSVVATFRGPTAAISLTSVNALAGDRIGVVVGYRFVNADPTDGITVFNTTARLYFGTSHTAQTVVGADATLGGTNVTTQAGWIEFSQTLTFAAAVAPPANDACVDAVVIATLPYHAPRLDTTESAGPFRDVWYTYTPPADVDVILTALGSNYGVNLAVFRGTCAGLILVGGASGGDEVWVQRAQRTRHVTLTGGLQYFFRVQTADGNGLAVPGGGGSLTFHVTERSDTLVDDDLYVDCQHIVKYRSGQLVQLTSDLYSFTPTGNAIDYTGRLLSGFGAHSAPRLYVGLFGDDPLIEVLDLATLVEVGFTFSNLDVNENVASVLFDRMGRVLYGWYGDNYDEIGALSSPAACRLRRMDGTELDSEAATPPEAEAFTLAQEVGGSDFVELAADQDTLWYTSAGRQIKRYSLTSGQLPDFVTVPVESGPRPGLRSTRLLPPGDGSGGLLVADGINVKRYSVGGTLIQVYTPTPSERAQDLDKIELTKAGDQFWVSDQLSTSLFRFDLATGVQLEEIITGLPTGQLSGFTIYNGFRAGLAPPPPEPEPGTPGVPGHGCPDDFPIAPGGGSGGCPVAFFP